MATYTVNITVVPSGSGTVKVGSSTIQGPIQEEGEEVNILALPASGFAFVSFVIDGGSPIFTQSYSFTMPSSDVEVVANFEALETPPNDQQASIYDTSCPRFLFVKDMADRFFEGDIVDMSVYDFTEFEEPIGFGDAKFRLERDENYHGFLYEFADDGLQFERDTVGYDYLKDQLLTYGVDVDLKFIYGFGPTTSFTIIYIGKVDTTEYSEIEDGDKIEFGLRELDFDTILQTGMEVVHSTEPTLDVLLYSKVIPKQVIYRVPRRQQIEDGGVESTYPAASFGEGITDPPSGIMYLFINDGREGDDDLEIFTTYDFQLDGREPRFEPAGYRYLLRAKLAGKYRFKVKVLLWLEYNNSSSAPTLDVTRLKIFKTQSDGTTIIGSVASYAPTVLNADPPADGYIDCLFDVETELDIDIEQCVYLYFETSGSVADLVNIQIKPFPSDSTLPELTVEVDTLAPASKGKFIKPLELLESTFSQAAETDYQIIRSDFFEEDGCGEKLSLTNGFGVRGYQDEERTYIKTSAKNLIDGLQKLFCLGWGVEYNEFKEEVVRIEPVEYFYQDVEILAFESISNYEKRIDASKYYNEVEIGFAKYSKERETDKGNTLDDFHTKHLYQTPVKTNKNKLPIISNLTLSGYEIEILRRKQFEKDGRNNNSNQKEDEELFGVQLADYTLFEGDTYSGFLTDLSEGDIIALNTTRIIVVGYAYFYAGQVVDVNVDSQGAKRVTVEKVQYGYFTPVGFPFSVQGTFIKFSSSIDSNVLPVTATVAIDTVSESYYVPEGNQPFSSVSNLVSPETAYNLRYTPKRMLYSWAKMINGGFFGKAGTDQVLFKQGDGNVKLSTQFNSGETCLLGDLDRETIVENSNVNIDDLYNRGFLYLPFKVSFSVNLTFEQLTLLKNCLRGRDDYRNYGYVTIINSCGEPEKIYLTSVEYNPVFDEAKIEGYLKEL